ncbi:hypothetical protein [Streptomyces fimbriatus]|uniref:Uncharacterized protein n=1 Tax=Streptomyces fimbriatus TaxID=68197 RepID=A0ABW0D636_STRFI
MCVEVSSADAVAAARATFGTINKRAAGTSGTLALDLLKPQPDRRS